MIKGFLDAIAHLVSKSSGAGHDLAAGSATPDIAAADLPVTDPAVEVFASKLEHLTADPEQQSRPLVAGSLELVGLEEVREALGERWEAVGAQANEVAEAELRRQLDAADFYRRYRDFSFVVCFASLDRAAADQRAREIGARLKAALIEQIPAIAQAIAVEHFVAEIDRASLAGTRLPIADQLVGTLERMRDEAAAHSRQSRAALLRDFQLQFSPAWHTGRHVVILNRCILDMTAGCRSLAQFQAQAEPAQLDQTLVELDCMLLAKAHEKLHETVQARSAGAFIVPVAFRTIDDPVWFAEYRRLLQMMPEAYAKFLIIEICDIPDAALPGRLGELIVQLSSFAKGIALGIRIDHPGLQPILEQLPWALAVDLAGTSSADPQVPQRLRRFASAAAAARTLSLAHGANSIGLALAAFEAGFTYVDGPAVHPTLREPKPPSPLNPLSASTLQFKSSRW